jgi:uncharacterized protein YraI
VIRRTFFLIVLLTGALFLAACGPESVETSEVVPTRTPRPTFTPTPFAEAAQPVVEQQPATPAPESPAVVAEQPPAASVEEEPSPTPEEPTPTPEPQAAKAVVNSPAVNLRGGPGTQYNLAGTTDRGTELEIVGKNPAGDWWQVCCVNGQTVWIANFLVDTTGPVDSVAVASNIPAPPAPAPVAQPQPQPQQPQPAAPTPVPAAAEPTAPPAPSFTVAKGGFVDPRPNSNPIISFFGWICKTQCPSAAVGGYKMIAEGPAGRFETMFEPSTLVGDPGLPSEFWYNAKLEIANTTPGTYRVWVADPGGNPVSEAWEFTVQNDIRIFLPRWVAP